MKDFAMTNYAHAPIESSLLYNGSSDITDVLAIISVQQCQPNISFVCTVTHVHSLVQTPSQYPSVMGTTTFLDS